MKTFTSKEIKERGSGIFALLYGGTGVGKSVSTLQSAPDPILYVIPEPRDVNRILKAAGRPDVRFEVAQYENWPGLIEFFANFDNFKKFNTVFVDSASHLMNIQLTQELQGQSFAAMDAKKADAKSLVFQTKMSEENWGALAGQMFRFANLNMKLAAECGKVVIWSALETSTPKWNRALAAAPNFGGRMFNRDFPGFFDLIGLVKPKEKDGKTVYPPEIMFDSPDDDFVAKATGGMAATRGPLNWEKILKL